MGHITKAISHLAKVSRGLDRSHPEYETKDQDKLAKHLRRAIKTVHKLERNHDGLQTDVCNINGMLVDLMVEIQEQRINYGDIPDRIVEILQITHIEESEI